MSPIVPDNFRFDFLFGISSISDCALQLTRPDTGLTRSGVSSGRARLVDSKNRMDLKMNSKLLVFNPPDGPYQVGKILAICFAPLNIVIN